MDNPAENKSPRSAGQPSGRKVGRPPLRLPFDGRGQDAGSWVYDHRIGLCITIIIYLAAAILFMGAKVAMTEHRGPAGIEVDLTALEELARERDRLQEEVSQRQNDIDWKSVRNITSNENALNEHLRDDRGTNMAALNRTAAEVEQRMRANREAYERGVAEARSAGERQDEAGTDDKRREDAKAKGRVTVSFSLVNPIRYSRRLDTPAYRCEGGGEVVVDIVVDRAGKVISAQAVSGGDECMRQCAVASARISYFDINDSAPAKQSGTITYIFIPQ